MSSLKDVASVHLQKPQTRREREQKKERERERASTCTSNSLRTVDATVAHVNLHRTAVFAVVDTQMY
jgi:hypothetical protein